MKTRIIFIFLFIGIISGSCTKKMTSKTMPAEKPGKISASSPPCIIYKTRSDYSQLVPVTLTADKSSIASYPGVRDIYYKEKLSYPTKLENGFLLDNRGIGPDVAFLNITYDEYAQFKTAPDPAELWKRILDKNPLTEMYMCGNKSDFADPVAELNEAILLNKLSQFKRLK